MDVVKFATNLTTAIAKMKKASELNMPVELDADENKAIIAALKAFRDVQPSGNGSRRGRT